MDSSILRGWERHGFCGAIGLCETRRCGFCCWYSTIGVCFAPTARGAMCWCIAGGAVSTKRMAYIYVVQSNSPLLKHLRRCCSAKKNRDGNSANHTRPQRPYSTGRYSGSGQTKYQLSRRFNVHISKTNTIDTICYPQNPYHRNQSIEPPAIKAASDKNYPKLEFITNNFLASERTHIQI